MQSIIKACRRFRVIVNKQRNKENSSCLPSLWRSLRHSAPSNPMHPLTPLGCIAPITHTRTHACAHTHTHAHNQTSQRMGFAVRVRSAGQKYGPTCHQRDRADVTEFVTLVRLSSLGQHVGVLALAGYKRRKSALTAGPIGADTVPVTDLSNRPKCPCCPGMV